jgi:hypothetical protein
MALRDPARRRSGRSRLSRYGHRPDPPARRAHRGHGRHRLDDRSVLPAPVHVPRRTGSCCRHRRDQRHRQPGGFVGPYVFGVLQGAAGSLLLGNLALAALLVIGAGIIFLPMFRPTQVHSASS